MTTKCNVAPHIFKSYDVRGEVDTELDETTARLIGAAAVKALSARTLAVGRDMRQHSPRLEGALIDGITAAGANAICIGQCSTPMSYFAAATLDVDGAIMVTASHNPSKDNGFKFSKRGGEPMGQGTGLERVREMVLSGEAASISAATPGSAQTINILDRWCTHLKQYLPDVRPLKMVLDCGNSVMGPILRELLRQVDREGKLDVVWLFDEPDGTFPWHPADPLKMANLQHLQGAVLATRADFGVAFDGDGDRLAFIDENARFIGCDLMTALFARRLLAQPGQQGKIILYDLRSSVAVKDAILKAGGVAEMCRVGHSHIKAAMRGLLQGTVRNPSLSGEILFAGELSGHFFFRDCFCIDSSERALLLALGMMTDDPRTLSRQVAPLRKFWHSGEVNFQLSSDPDKHEVLQRIEQIYAKNRLLKLDGVSVETDTWWFNVRLSNTEPVVRLTAESFESSQALSQLLERIQRLIEDCGGTSTPSGI